MVNTPLTILFILPATTPTLYLLSNIQKASTPERPIISGYNGPTFRLSKYYTYYFFKFLVSTIPSFLNDSTDFLKRIIQRNHVLPSDVILLTKDVKSLYTSILHDKGISVAIEYLNRYNPPRRGELIPQGY